MRGAKVETYFVLVGERLAAEIAAVHPRSEVRVLMMTVVGLMLSWIFKIPITVSLEMVRLIVMLSLIPFRFTTHCVCELIHPNLLFRRTPLICKIILQTIHTG